MRRNGIVTLARVSHFWPLPEPAKSLEMLKRHEAKRSELGGELCQCDNALETHFQENYAKSTIRFRASSQRTAAPAGTTRVASRSSKIAGPAAVSPRPKA